MLLLILAAFFGYLAFWHFVTFRVRYHTPVGARPSMLVKEHFNAPIAQLAAKMRGIQPGHVCAITLPDLFRCRANVFYNGNHAPGSIRRHEIAGHVPEIERMGPLNYLPTYVWHSVFLRDTWPQHEMEIEAVGREKQIPDGWYRDLGEA